MLKRLPSWHADQRFLGDQDFTEAMWAEEEEPPPRAKDTGGIEAAAKKLVKHLDIDLSVLRGADRSWVVSKARKRVGYVLARRAGYRLKDVAAYLGRDTATLATQLARMNNDMAGDLEEKREIERLVKIVMK